MVAQIVPKLTLLDIASAYWPVLVCSFLTALLATPVCRAIALRRNIVDRPDDWLKPHRRPIPYLGGVAIFVAWAAGIIVGIWWIGRAAGTGGQTSASVNLKLMIGVLVGGTLSMGLGLFDDLRLASPVVKLAGNIAAALVLVAVGLGDDFVLLFLERLHIPLQSVDRWLGWVYTVPLTVFIVVGACNATNLLDGLDGLCSGVLSIIAFGFLVVAVHMHMYSTWAPDDVQRVLVCLAMMGAALGFLPYNRNPATIFMGDAGSMLLGFNAAVVILMFAESDNVRWMLGAIVVFGLPIGDMMLALIRRWRAQRPLMRGDRSHFYDQLCDRGLPVRRVVAISYGLAAIYVAVGCLVPIFLRTRHGLLVYFLLGLATLAAIKVFRMVRVDSPSSKPDSTD